MVVYANHANFSKRGEQFNPSVKSRLCLWSKGGKGKVIINEKEFPLRSGDYLFLPWGFSIHYQPDPNNPFFLAGIHLIPEMDHLLDPPEHKFHVAHNPNDPLSDVISRKDIPISGLNELIQYHLQPEDPLMLLSEAIVSHFQSPSRDAHQLRSLAKVLIYQLQHTRSLRSVPPKLRKLLQHLDDHLSDVISIGDLADILELSESQVRRIFRQWLQLSPLEYLTQKRIEKASILLTTSRHSIEQIAYEVGFDDPFYFSRVFKKIRGVSPSAHRHSTSFL